MLFSVYLATGPNRFTETVCQPREFVGTIEAETVGVAYHKTQNLTETWNKENPGRSVSVGDVLVDPSYNKLMVIGVGFKDITKEICPDVANITNSNMAG